MSEVTKRKRGRPKINIDETTFKKLCELQCTREEISGFIGCSHDTLERWCKKTYGDTFEHVFAQLRQGGRISLRRSQFKIAQKNATMAIWLGKQYLGQKDEQTINQNVVPIVIKDDISEND